MFLLHIVSLPFIRLPLHSVTKLGEDVGAVRVVCVIDCQCELPGARGYRRHQEVKQEKKGSSQGNLSLSDLQKGFSTSRGVVTPSPHTVCRDTLHPPSVTVYLPVYSSTVTPLLGHWEANP